MWVTSDELSCYFKIFIYSILIRPLLSLEFSLTTKTIPDQKDAPIYFWLLDI